MTHDLEKLRQLTETLTSNGYLTDQAASWEYAFDSVKAFVCITNTSFKVKYINKPLRNTLNIKSTQCINKDLHTILGDKDLQKELDSNQGIQDPKEGVITYQELFIKSFNGWYESHRHDITTDHGELIGYIYLFVDVTQKRLTLEALKKSEKNYRLLFESMLDGFALHKMIFNDDGEPYDYEFINVNPAFEKLTGLTTKQLVNHSALEVLPKLEQHWFDVYIKVVQTGESYRFSNYSAELCRYYDVVVFRPMPGYFACIISDITDRTLAEENLHMSERRFREIIEKVEGIAIRGYDDKFNVIFWNKACETLYGYTKQEAEGENIEDLTFLKGLKVPVEEFLDNWFDDKEPPSAQELILKNKLGEDVHIFSSNVLHQGANGKEMFCIDIDLNPIKDAQKALYDTNLLLNGILNAIPDVIVVQDADHNVIKHNKTAKEFFNVTSKKAEGKKCFHYLGRGTNCTDCQTAIAMATKKPSKLERYIEELQGWFDCRSYPILDTDGNVTKIIEHLRDISDWKKEQELYKEVHLKVEQAFHRLRFIVRAVDGFLWEKTWDMEKNAWVLTYVDPQFCREFYYLNGTDEEVCEKAYGKSTDNLLQFDFNDLDYKNSFANVCMLTDKHCLEQEEASEYFEMGYMNNVWTILKVRKTPLYDGRGKCTGILGFAKNCSDDSYSIKELLEVGIQTNRIKKLTTGSNRLKLYWVVQRKNEAKDLTHLDFP